jgi:hypothetical protein
LTIRAGRRDRVTRKGEDIGGVASAGRESISGRLATLYVLPARIAATWGVGFSLLLRNAGTVCTVTGPPVLNHPVELCRGHAGAPGKRKLGEKRVDLPRAVTAKCPIECHLTGVFHHDPSHRPAKLVTVIGVTETALALGALLALATSCATLIARGVDRPIGRARASTAVDFS